MAGVLVVPVDQVHVAVRPGLQRQRNRPLVVRQEEVRVAVGDVTAPARFDLIDVEPVAVQVAHEQLAVVLLRPRSALVAHEARVGVPAAGAVAAAVAAVRRRPDVVPVVRDGLDVVERVRVEVRAALPAVPAALDHVPHVRDDARFDEEVAVRVVVQPPRVRRAVREHLERVPRRVVAPHARVDRRALVVRRVRPADFRVREDAVTAVEPAVRPPDEAVQRLVRVLVTPTVEQNLRLTRGLVRLLVMRDEHEVRCRADPHAAEPDLDAADEVQALHEHGALVELACARRVLEDDDLVALRLVLLRQYRPLLRVAPRIGVRFHNPQPAAVVEAERDRLVNVRLAREQRHREPRRYGHRLRSFKPLFPR